MKVSFIIASINQRSNELEACISTIEQAYQSYVSVAIEIICIFQNNTHIQLNSTQGSQHVVQYVIPEKGLSVARNCGIKKSTGTYLVFLDDDAGVQKDFLKVLHTAIQSNELDAVSGSIVDPITQECFSQCFVNSSPKYIQHREYKYFLGSSHVLKKSAIIEAGLYDTRFGVGGIFGGAEESDVLFRLLKRKGIVRYLPELVFYHPIVHTTAPQKIFSYSSSVGALFTKHMITDLRHWYIYFLLLSEILIKSIVRSGQMIVASETLKRKNDRFQYRAVLLGTLHGVGQYLREVCT